MERYSRQIILPEIGVDGQKALQSASVLVVGIGGLGCPAALYLVAAGVGRIGLVDGDTVDLGNLQRQVLFGDEDLGRGKTEAARDRLGKMNPDIRIDVYPEDLRAENAVEIFRKYDVILDGTDNFATKFLIHDAALVAGKPVVSAGVSGAEGWLGVFGWSDGPCFRCWRPKAPVVEVLSCRELGVMAPVAGVIGCLQAAEVLKVILLDHAGKKEWAPLSGRILAVDLAAGEFRELQLPVRKDCPCRGPRASIPIFSEPRVRCSTESGIERDWPAPEEGFAVLDVREPAECLASQGIPDAFHWPLSRIELGEETVVTEAADRWLVVCQHGVRSARAVGVLRGLFPGKEFVSLRGGLSHFREYEAHH